MAVNIEKLLRLTADYHNFCRDDYAATGNKDKDELSLEELDFVAAATGESWIEPDWDQEKKRF